MEIVVGLSGKIGGGGIASTNKHVSTCPVDDTMISSGGAEELDGTLPLREEPPILLPPYVLSSSSPSK